MAGLLGEGSKAMKDEQRITTLEAREIPSAKSLIDECKEAIVAASAQGMFSRLLRCHNTRHCEWSYRQQDGRLGDKDEEMPTFRFKGAPDIRVPLCDTIVRWLTLLRMSVFNRGTPSIGPQRLPQSTGNTGTDTVGLAQLWQGTMEHFLSVSDWVMSKAFKLFSTCVEELGHGILLADWRPTLREELCVMTLQQLSDALIAQNRALLNEELAAEAMAAGISPDAMPGITPDQDAALVQESLIALEQMLMEPGPTGWALVQSIDSRITDAEAKRVLSQLRKAATVEASYFAPKDDGGTWVVEAPVPWVSALYPHDFRGDGNDDWFARPVYLSEAQVRARAMAENWDKAGVAELLENGKNKFWAELSWAEGADWILNGTGIGLNINVEAMEKMPRFLVVEMWRKVTNRKGLPRIAKAIFNPHLTDHLLLWLPTDLDRLPVVMDTSEAVTYVMQAKGAADIIEDKQNFVKDSLDAEGARGRLGSNPPLMRTLSQHVDMRPGVQLYTKRSGMTFEGSQFMEIPGVDIGHLKIVEKVELLVNQYYFRDTTTLPEDRAMFTEEVIYRSLRAYRELLRVLWFQVQENIESLQISRINGIEVQLDARRDQLQGEADVHIGVHLDGYSKDAAEKFVKVFTQLSQADRFGNLDAAEGMKIATELLAPTYARRLAMSSEKASSRVIDEQEGRIAKIMAGVPVSYAEQISNPGLRLQVMEQWLSVPGNAQRAQTDPVIGQLMQKELEWLTFQQQQQTVNPTTGRTGVTPNEPTTMGGTAA